MDLRFDRPQIYPREGIVSRSTAFELNRDETTFWKRNRDATRVSVNKKALLRLRAFDRTLEASNKKFEFPDNGNVRSSGREKYLIIECSLSGVKSGSDLIRY